MNKQQQQEYYVGLDIGTDSVGWAVSDLNYNVIKFRDKHMWGVRAFDEAQTAAERRKFRAARRRLHRKRQRVELLQEIFAEEISKIDIGFFRRLNDSRLDKDDKTAKHIFFNDPGFNDKKYYKKYPTIYHLRRALITGTEKPDIRLLYLALHHIIKYRGHFLINGDIKNAKFKDAFKNFKDALQNLSTSDEEEDPDNISCDAEELESLLKSNKSKTDKKAEVKKLLKADKKNKPLSVLSELLAGSKINIGDMADDGEKISMSFADQDYDQKREDALILGEDVCNAIDCAKVLYDSALLSKILDGQEYLSEAKIAVYEKHKNDLKNLKNAVKNYLPEKYNDIFAPKESLYATYAGHKNSEKRTARDGDLGFYKQLKDMLQTHRDKKCIDNILKEIDAGVFLPLQTHSDNGVIPYQIHLLELKKILDNAEKHYPFLSEKDGEGYSAKHKIEKIFTFRIPYYVGPLNDGNQDNTTCWVRRKENGPVKPWNFESKVDEEASAKEFISRMTNKCTYLVGEDVLPRYSLLYSEFTVLNELNNLKIIGEKINTELKQKIFEELFQEKNKVSGKALQNYLKKEGRDVNIDDITGFDKDFASSLSSYLDFKKKVFKGEEHRLKEYDVRCAVEEIIKWITIYGDEKNFVKKKIEKEYKNMFSSDQIKTICGFKYSGWGRLSEKLLTGFEGIDTTTGEVFSVIKALHETNDNFMQIVESSKYSFSENIKKHNDEIQGKNGEISYDALIKDAYLSPSVKRAVWQAIKLTEEIKNIMGNKNPKKIFIEMARGDKEAKKERTKSRKDQLQALYKSIKSDEYSEIKDALGGADNDSLRSKKIYLYYLQCGKSMYSDTTINLARLTTDYDIDHIYPQSKIKDDSLDNTVLVTKKENKDKDDKKVSSEIQKKMHSFWEFLLGKGLISKEKFNRLMRNSDFTTDELAGFINRQLVETRQSTKATAEILKKTYEGTKIVYVKAQNVSDFRKMRERENDKLPIPEFIKSRTVNDHHHAKDAYLNIVVGNVWDSKFTGDPACWLKQNPEKSYHLNKLFDNDLGQNGSVWKAGADGSIKTVRKFMAKNDVLYTRYAYINKGAFFNQQIVSDNPTVPIKKDISLKYGGYKSINPAYFSLIAHKDKKGNEVRSIEAVPIYLRNAIEKDPQKFIEYCTKTLGLKEPVVKIKCIKKDAMLIIDGFPMHLRGTNDDKIFLQPALQFCLKTDLIGDIKKIEKFIERQEKDRNARVNEQHDDISSARNEELYLELIKRSECEIYKKRPANQAETLKKGKDMFQHLSLEEQCKVLTEILKLFACKSWTADLTLINGVKNAGKVAANKKISNMESVLLINQSATGLSEKKIDLLKI